MQRLFDQLLTNHTWLRKSLFYLALICSCYLAFKIPEDSIQQHMNDKVSHFIGFFVLSFLFQLAYPKVSFAIIFVCLACFGMGIEIVQAFLPYRSYELLDWFADQSGVMAYLLFIAPIFKRQCLKDKSVLD